MAKLCVTRPIGEAAVQPVRAEAETALWLDGVLLLPYAASANGAIPTRMVKMAAANLVAGIKGQRPPNLVNPEVLSQ